MLCLDTNFKRLIYFKDYKDQIPRYLLQALNTPTFGAPRGTFHCVLKLLTDISGTPIAMALRFNFFFLKRNIVKGIPVVDILMTLYHIYENITYY